MWMPSIYSYIKHIQLFSCPSSNHSWTGSYVGNYFAYPLNSYLAGQKLASVYYPAECVSNVCGYYYRTNGANNAESSIGSPPSVRKFHNEGTNAVHVDGHAKWYRFDYIWRGNSLWPGNAAAIKHWSLTGS